MNKLQREGRDGRAERRDTRGGGLGRKVTAMVLVVGVGEGGVSVSHCGND